MDFSVELAIGLGDLGLRPWEFWRLTPAEFDLILAGHNRAQQSRLDESLYLAWHTAAFQRVDKMPTLASLFEKADESKPAKKEQTADDMLTMAKMLTIAFGGTITET